MSGNSDIFFQYSKTILRSHFWIKTLISRKNNNKYLTGPKLLNWNYEKNKRSKQFTSFFFSSFFLLDGWTDESKLFSVIMNIKHHILFIGLVLTPFIESAAFLQQFMNFALFVSSLLWFQWFTWVTKNNAAWWRMCQEESC